MKNSINSIRFWKNIGDKFPVLETSSDDISMLHMDGITYEIVLCGNQCGGVNNFDSLLVILDLSKISKEQKKQILKKDFSICEVDFVYDDSSITVYQLPSTKIEFKSGNCTKVIENEKTLSIEVNRKELEK